jgi:hypothetical protein
MTFKETYTTDKLILDDKTDEKLEAKKIILSNDYYMLGEMLECLLNKWGK